MSIRIGVTNAEPVPVRQPLDRLLEELDFDAEIPCDNPDCEHLAAWIMWRIHCCPPAPHVLVVCHCCRDYLWNGSKAICDGCHRHYTPARAIFIRVEALNQRMRGGS